MQYQMKDNLKLTGIFKLIILVFCLQLSCCAPYQRSFMKNSKVSGYVIFTTNNLLDKHNNVVSPTPMIFYYFLPQKYINKTLGSMTIKDGAHFYELYICETVLQESYMEGGDTLFYIQNNYLECTILNKKKLLIKKEFREKHDSFYNQKGYKICLNNQDTINIRLSYHFKLVNEL